MLTQKQIEKRIEMAVSVVRSVRDRFCFILKTLLDVYISGPPDVYESFNLSEDRLAEMKNQAQTAAEVFPSQLFCELKHQYNLWIKEVFKNSNVEIIDASVMFKELENIVGGFESFFMSSILRDFAGEKDKLFYLRKGRFYTTEYFDECLRIAIKDPYSPFKHLFGIFDDTFFATNLDYEANFYPYAHRLVTMIKLTDNWPWSSGTQLDSVRATLEIKLYGTLSLNMGSFVETFLMNNRSLDELDGED